MSTAISATDSRRFAFGKNWTSFLRVLDDERILEAERSLCAMLGRERIRGASFLDVGSGSGLFSLAAMRLGARRVHSFDFDPQSVACAAELKKIYFPDADAWSIEQGSALDEKYLRALGKWDIVYSWGVLHHTGNMWRALENVSDLVADGGALFISLYNDQGTISVLWRRVKVFYNSGWFGRAAVVSVFFPYFVARGLIADMARRRNPFARYREHRRTRGMSVVHDWIDWLGGYPFEVAAPEQVVDFGITRDLVLARIRTCGGSLGCNEYVFRRKASPEVSVGNASVRV